MSDDCGHAPEGSYTLCLRCMRGLQSALVEALAEYEKLDASPAQGTGDGPSGQKPKSKSPANDHVISLRDARTEGTLPRLLRDALAHQGSHVFGTVRDNHTAVMRRIVGIARERWAPSFLRDVRHALVQLRRANGEKPRARVGTCDCGGPLYAPDAGFVLDCGACGLVYDATEQAEAILGEG